MENYCLLLLILIFLTSMIGSLLRSDFNSTYSLLAYVYMTQYRSKQSLGKTLLVLILVTSVMIAADVWAFFLQNGLRQGKIAGFIVILIEILEKLFLLVMLIAWKFRGDKTTDN